MTHKLLLVDASVAIQRVIELTFAAEDVEVVSVSDGDEAIARIPLERPDIVLADIGMAKRSGYDVAAFVKQRADLSHIPVLLLAGAFEPVDESRAAQVKSDGVLVKPFGSRQVIARVRELVAGVKRQAPGVEPLVQAAAHRLPGAERRTPVPASPGQDARTPDSQPALSDPWAADESLDRYFDRLDAALATRGSAPAPVSRQAVTADAMDRSVEGAVPTVDDVLSDASLFTPPDEALTSMRMSVAPPVADASPAGVPPTAAAVPRPASGPAAPPRNTAAPAAGDPAMADVFSALFAAEQGEPGAVRIHLGPRVAQAAVTEDLVEQVTRRVVARLAPDAVRSLVADVVSEVAERLVREEIARIRGK